MIEITEAMRKALVVVVEADEPISTNTVASKLYPGGGTRGAGQRVGNASKLLYRLVRAGLVKCHVGYPTDKWSSTPAGDKLISLG